MRNRLIRSRSCCRPGVDGVVVSAATPAHAELTLAAVERGLPTFCEKPIASTAAESARVAEVIARSGVPVQVGYQRRFDAAFAAAKRAVDDGSLGPLHTVRSTTMDPAPPPMDYIAGPAASSATARCTTSTCIRWITGQQAVEVYATGSVQGDPQFAEYGDVDTAAVLVTFDAGHARRRVGRPLQRPRLRLPAGGARLPRHGGRRLGSGRTRAKCRSRQRVPGRPGAPLLHGPVHRRVPRRAGAFVDVVNGTAAPACTVADAVEVAWLAEAATESLQRRVPVRIEEVRSR